MNKKLFVWHFQARRFQNSDRIETVSESFTCDRQFWTEQIAKICAEIMMVR